MVLKFLRTSTFLNLKIAQLCMIDVWHTICAQKTFIAHCTQWLQFELEKLTLLAVSQYPGIFCWILIKSVWGICCSKTTLTLQPAEAWNGVHWRRSLLCIGMTLIALFPGSWEEKMWLGFVPKNSVTKLSLQQCAFCFLTLVVFSIPLGFCFVLLEEISEVRSTTVYLVAEVVWVYFYDCIMLKMIMSHCT